MKNISNFNQEIAECVGLWLAEGDRKTKSEITFTNNCIDLIGLFYKTLIQLFPEKKNRIRIYIYSNGTGKINFQYRDIITKTYVDVRARKPYCILRLASVDSLKKWRKIVEEVSSDNKVYTYLLRGFFAGEGNIKEGSHNSRGLRIAQKEKTKFLEDILLSLGIKNFTFKPNERSYIIHGKYNWDIFADLRLTDLHPGKRERFWEVYNKFKQEHYEKNYLRDNILLKLENHMTTRELSKKFNRSFARIQDILIDLKKLDKIRNFRIGNVDYWTNKRDLILISKIKNKYLLYLNKSRRTSEFAKKFNVNPKSSFRRLKELSNLNLVERNRDKRWKRTSINKKILVIK